MSGQYDLTEGQMKRILKILKEAGVSVEPHEQTLNEKTGKYEPFHREVSIQVSSYDDESEKYEMYVQVD